jgi:hypothetical protein
MRRIEAVALGAALAFGMGESCPNEAMQAASSIAGCYQFQYDAGAKALGLPWGVVLEDAALGPGWPLVSDRPGVRRATTALSATERADHPFGYWAPAKGDSIEIGHPGGGGFVLTLAPSGQDLIGRGYAAGDVVRPGQPMGAERPSSPVVARRVLCGAS